MDSLVCRPRFRMPALVLSACAGLALFGGSLQANAPVPPNLAGGLDVLVQSRVDLKSAKKSGVKPQTFVSASGTKYTNQQAVDLENDSLTNADDGRVMVMIHLNGLQSFKAMHSLFKTSVASLTITAVDKTYKGGVIEGWISVDDVAAVAETWGVGSVMLEAKPEHNRIRRSDLQSGGTNATQGEAITLLGTAFDQGVTQHRVDQVNKFYNPSATFDYEGQGLSIACLSDSFGATTTVTTATDVTNFDLPGASNNPVGNTTPVTVLADFTGGTDEGRAMCQIVYKMAPKANVGFATADTGEVGFANNIRALAGLPGYTYSGQTFAADVICDDVGYQDEPFFEDGIVGNAVDDVSAAGVAYFSSAGNDIGTYDYDSDFRYVPNGTGLTAAAGNTALAGTNINLANVPTNLYQGGFHNFNPAGKDVALTYNVQGGTSLPVTNFQWNDPYNQTLSYNTPAIFTGAGNIDGTTTTSVTFTTPSLTAGQNYVILETADAGSSFDGIVTVTDPNGTVVVNAQDTGTDETINLYPAVTGPYTITVKAYSTTTGPFHVNVYTGNNQRITTDFNILTFDLEGNYLPNSSLVANNLTTNVPYDAKKTTPKTGETQVQYLVSRSAIPTAPNPANHFRILIRGNGLSGIGPAEYFTYNTPNTKGHAMAVTCNGTAAYSVFRPSVPEYFTSPGPVTIYFDKTGNRLSTPEIRLQPRIAAADAANSSFFASDSASDLDTKPNFSGTSAAAPHAAACALLTLQAHGGHRSLTPAQMTTLLQSSTFPHDLDPNAATGTARTSAGGKVTITINSDLGLNPSAGAFNPNSIAVAYTGAGTLTSLVFNPIGTAGAAGNNTGGNNGVDANNAYFSNLYPGLVFEPSTIAFTPGTLTGLASSDVVAAFSNQAPAPSVTGQFWTMALTFPTGNFTGGKVLRFTVGHGPQHSSSVAGAVPGTGPTGGATSTSFTQADLFGGSTIIPDGVFTNGGMQFNGTTSDGGTFSGLLNNHIGSGYSVTDGYGFINVQTAVSQTVQAMVV